MTRMTYTLSYLQSEKTYRLLSTEALLVSVHPPWRNLHYWYLNQTFANHKRTDAVTLHSKALSIWYHISM